MKSRRNQEKLAKALFKKSLTGGTVDEKKVQQILKSLAQQKPPQLINILKIYKKIIASAQGKKHVLVETAIKVENQKKLEQDITNKTGQAKITFKINPNIILGAKITHGDWVWDETLQAKLAQLTTDN